MKKLMSILLALALVITTNVTFAAAANNGPCDKPITWEDEEFYLAFLTIFDDTVSQESGQQERISLFSDNTVHKGVIKGAEYDLKTNTLTLTNFKNSKYGISANMMGDDFKIKVVGNCEIATILVWGDGYGGSLEITGNGTLTVNANKRNNIGIDFECELTNSKFKISKDVTVKAYGKEKAVDFSYSTISNKSGVMYADGKSVTGIAGEQQKSYIHSISGVYAGKSPIYYGIQLKKASDPDGIYSRTEYGDVVDGEWVSTSYEICKYIYIKELDCYIKDMDASCEMSFDEFEKSDFSVVMVKDDEPQIIESYRVNEVLPEGSYHAAYMINNPNDSNGLYYTTQYIYEDCTTDNWKYTLRKFEYDKSTDTYVETSKEEGIKYKDLVASGMTFKYGADGEPVKFNFDSDEDGKIYTNWAVNMSNDPNGIYGLNDYPLKDGSEVYTIKRLVYSNERNRYEEDETFKDIDLTQDEFEKAGYTYKYNEVEKPFYEKFANISWLELMKDSKGKKYAIENNSKPKIFDFAENKKIQVGDNTYYILTPSKLTSIDDLEDYSMEVDTEYYHYYYNGTSYIYDPKAANVTDISKSGVATVAAIANQVYTGKAITPAVTVKVGSTKLTKGTDYTVAYKNNINAGTATVTITGKGKYKGSKSVTFKITAKKITPAVTLSATSYNYSGKVITPAVTVKTGSRVLKKGTDYTVTYGAGRKNVGTYKVIVKLKGNYSGSRTVSFNINPKGTTLKSLVKASKALTVKWSKQAAKMATTTINGYEIQYSTNAKFASNTKSVKVSGVNTVTKKITGLKGNTKYFVRIRTFKKVGTKVFYSAWSAVKNAVTAK